jgi:hypothetical protein
MTEQQPRRRGRIERPSWLGWGAQWWMFGAYFVIVWGDGPVRLYRSPNGTPWHHGAQSILGQRVDRECVCEDCLSAVDRTASA